MKPDAGVSAGKPNCAKAVLIMITVAVSAVAMPDARATGPAGPAGYITISRDVPIHNAFHAREIGQPTKVATAREDVVIVGTSIQNQAPQSLPDSALDHTGSIASVNLGVSMTASAVVAPGFTDSGSAIRSIGSVMGQTTSSIQSGVTHAMPSGALARAMAPAGNVLSSMPRAR